jgi:hypothetical protein
MYLMQAMQDQQVDAISGPTCRRDRSPDGYAWRPRAAAT